MKTKTKEPIRSPFCARLRTKKFYFLERPALSEDELLDASCDAWCGATMHRTGPDSELVNPEDCTEDRGCFEAL